MCAAAAGFAVMAALAIAESSTTGAFAACMSCLLCRGLFSCGPAVRVHDNDAWVQRRCSVGRMMCAQLPLDSQMWYRCKGPNRAQLRLLPRAQAVCSAAACFRAALRCLYTITMRGAAALPGGLHAACTAAAGFAAVTALAIAELSATEAIAARSVPRRVRDQPSRDDCIARRDRHRRLLRGPRVFRSLFCECCPTRLHQSGCTSTSHATPELTVPTCAIETLPASTRRSDAARPCPGAAGTWPTPAALIYNMHNKQECGTKCGICPWGIAAAGGCSSDRVIPAQP